MSRKQKMDVGEVGAVDVEKGYKYYIKKINPFTNLVRNIIFAVIISILYPAAALIALISIAYGLLIISLQGINGVVNREGPPTPTGLTATAGSNHVSLTWNEARLRISDDRRSNK